MHGVDDLASTETKLLSSETIYSFRYTPDSTARSISTRYDFIQFLQLDAIRDNMKVYASLWSANLLALGEAVDRIDALVDGYHLDIMDGVCVPDLLFGLDFVAALRRRTKNILDVHLMLTNTDAWIDRYAEAGSNLLTVHRRFCQNVAVTLNDIRSSGARRAWLLNSATRFRSRAFTSIWSIASL
jgi:Ribulose-phosphate 3 epimerase family